MKNAEKNRLIKQALEDEIGQGGHRIFYEVASGKSTRADAVAIPPPDSERGIRAYEFKADRQDFRHELKNPDKRAPWRNLASAFTFVVFDGVASADEIPEGCGLFVVDEDGELHRKVEPERSATDSISPDLARQVIRKARNITLQTTDHERHGVPVEELVEYDGAELTDDDLTDIVHEINDHIRSAPGLDRQAKKMIFEAFGGKDELRERLGDLRERDHSYVENNPLRTIAEKLVEALSEPAPGFHPDTDVAELHEQLNDLIGALDELQPDDDKLDDGEDPDDFLSPS